jgi:DNA invertase Pin-like site-specific DNA recombinase
MTNAKRCRLGNPSLAIAYLRASTSEQHLSPSAQRASIEAWAAREGVTVVAWHVDAGVSGGAELAARPALLAALAGLRAHRAGLLIVAKRDRLARDLVIAATIERAADGAGARVVAADGAGNGDTPSDALMRGILDVFSAHERAVIRARTSAALQAKRARGERAGTVPFGFSADADGRLVPNAAEQSVIAIVAELRAAGLSLRAIVAELAARGVRSRGALPLALPQVAKIARMRAAA